MGTRNTGNRPIERQADSQYAWNPEISGTNVPGCFFLPVFIFKFHAYIFRTIQISFIYHKKLFRFHNRKDYFSFRFHAYTKTRKPTKLRLFRGQRKASILILFYIFFLIYILSYTEKYRQNLPSNPNQKKTILHATLRFKDKS